MCRRPDFTPDRTSPPPDDTPGAWVRAARLVLLTVFVVVGYMLLAPQLRGAEPARPLVRFPVVPAASPLPADAPVKLTADRLYVIDSDIPLIVLSSPDGLVKVSDEPGPLRIRGRFADGGEKVETRNYTGKHLYTVDVVDGKSGRCELIVIPKGIDDAGKVVRRLIDCNTAPQPPPPVPPDPKPSPGPEPVPPGTRELWLIVVEETADRTPDTAKLLNDFPFWDGLAKRGHKSRFYDQDSPDAKAKGFPAKVTERPGLLILSTSGEVLSAGKLGDAASVEAAVRKAGGK